MELKDMCFAVRKALDITQKELAAMIGTNQTEISFIERGFIPPNSQKISDITMLYKLHCDVSE